MFWASTCRRSATITGIVGAGGIGLHWRSRSACWSGISILMIPVAVLVRPSAAIAFP
jgi:ABC-type phosphate/phosphonate transport system permease subunit